MIAVVFPGQGSQAIGMGRELYERYEAARLTFAEADSVLGYELSRLCFEGPLEELSRTEVTQPALLACSIAVLRVLVEGHFQFDVAFGHSLGEYTALVATDALGFGEAVDLVRRRGEAMAAAAEQHPGAMIAVIGLDDEAVEALCGEAADVWPANYNSAGQIVVSGTVAGIDELEERARDAGAKRVVRLSVGGGFHSPLMEEAAEAMRGPLQAAHWAEPAPQFFSTCTGDYEPEHFDELLVRQIVSPVRFVQAVRRLYADGCSAFAEAGPGTVLAGLIKRIEPQAATAAAGDAASVAAVSGGAWRQRQGGDP